MRRTAIAALGISVLLHGVALVGGDFAFAPRVEPELPPVMQARLIEPPPVVRPPAPAREVRPQEALRAPPAPRPRPIANRVRPPHLRRWPGGTVGHEDRRHARCARTAADDRHGREAVAPAAPMQVAERRAGRRVDSEGRPDRGSIVFRVFMGDKGLRPARRSVTGRDEHHYHMNLLQTTGLIG